MKSRIGMLTLALTAFLALTGLGPAAGTLRVYNISALAASVSVDGGPYKDLGNSDFSATPVGTGRHIISVKRRGTTTHQFQLIAENAYASPNGGMHWCVRLGNGTADLLPVRTCGNLVDNGG